MKVPINNSASNNKTPFKEMRMTPPNGIL